MGAQRVALTTIQRSTPVFRIPTMSLFREGHVKTNRTAVAAVGVVVMGAVALITSCIIPPPTTATTGLVPVRPACGADQRTEHPHQMISDSAISVLRGNGYCQLHIPEYHDEQRLHNGAGDYGPIAYAFASPSLRDHLTHEVYDNGWVNVAIVDIKTLDPADIPDSYKEMGFGPGVNCVYLHHDHDWLSADDWEAVVSPPVSGACSGSTGKRLSVHREDGPAGAEHYPPVARFIERPNRNAMLGIRCADGWCVVGARKKSAIPMSAHRGASDIGPGVPVLSNRWTVKGWFDEQYLGVPTVEGAHGILPFLRASLIPDDDLGSRTLDDFRAGWVRTAYVYIPRQALIPSKYSFEVRDRADGGRDTVGFGLTYGLNTIEMTGSDTEGCTWKARVVNSRFKDGLIRKVCRVDHSGSGFPVPATARFRWLDSDEKIWTACHAGCCMVEDDGM